MEFITLIQVGSKTLLRFNVRHIVYYCPHDEEGKETTKIMVEGHVDPIFVYEPAAEIDRILSDFFID